MVRNAGRWPPVPARHAIRRVAALNQRRPRRRWTFEACSSWTPCSSSCPSRRFRLTSAWRARPRNRSAGRNGFDALLFPRSSAPSRAARSASFPNLHEKPPSYLGAVLDGAQGSSRRWRQRRCSVSRLSRVTTIALFSRPHGEWVFFIFFMHAVIVLAALRFWPRLVGGGVPTATCGKSLCHQGDRDQD